MKLNLEKDFADWALIELIDRQLHLAAYAYVYAVSLYRTLHYTTHLITERAREHDKNNTQCQPGKEPD